MTDPTINFPPSFFTDAHLSEMWSYTRYFIAYYQKIIMILAALIVAGMVSVLIVDISVQARAKGGTKDDEDDEDFEYY